MLSSRTEAGEIKFHSLEEFLTFLQDCIANNSDGG